jgi:Ca-activated chloride channel family protein
MRAKLQIAIADIAKAREEYPRAKAQYEGVVADPRSGRTDVAKQAELKIAEVDRLTRNYDAATERLEKLETDGNASVKSEARFQQAQIKFDQEDYAGAREALARVKEIAPDHKEAALLEGKLTVRTGKLMEATEIRLGSASPAADPKPSVDGPPVLDTLRPDTPGISKPDDNRTENGRKQNQSKYSPTVFNFPALQDSKVSEEVEKEFQKTHDTVTMAGTGSGSAIGENLATRGDLSVVAGEVARASRGTYTVNDSRVVSGKGGKMGAGGGSHGGWPDGMDGEKPDAPVTPDPVTPAPAPVAPPKASSTPVKPRVPAVFNPFVASAEQPLSTFAIDVDTASYTRTRQAILAGQLPEPEAVRTEEVVNAFDYGDRAPDHATFRIFVEGSPSPFGHGTSLVRLGIKGRRLGREESRPAVLTFVVDASGSMAQPDRFGLARLALDELLGRLGPNDRIQLIAFNDTARVLTEPIASSGRKEILAAFDRIQCTGSTHLESGLRLAYDRAAAAFRPGAENRVILISDGVANLGTGAAADILTHIDAARRQGITLAVFGVGRGTYNDEMLEQLANRGDGTYRFLDSADEVRRAFVDDLAATLYTIASDVKIQVEWFPAAVTRYRQLGYENRALTAEQFRDDTVDAGEVGSGQSVTALYEIERAALAPRAAAEAPLGMVRVRYRPATGGPVAEISRPILAADLAASFQSTRPQFRVAACAAAFAERLRGSPYANGFSFADVANVIRPAVMEFTLDARLADLLRLIEAADRLAK